MKKQVNLYQPSCYPKREKATFVQFLVLFLFCISASLLSYLTMNQQTLSANDQLLEHKSSIADYQLQLSSLVNELQNKRAPDDKLRLHSMLQNEVKAKQRLITTLAGIDVEELVSFSELMRGLAYANMPDLTIHHFSMTSGTLNIIGDAKQGDSVPLWLSNMQLIDELSDIAFKALSIKEKKGIFTFQLTNSEIKGKNSE
jgi:hypothetical protein